MDVCSMRNNQVDARNWCQAAQLCQEYNAQGQPFQALNEIKTEDVDNSNENS